MDGKFKNNPFRNEQEDNENSMENSGDSPCSASGFNESKMTTSTSSPKRRRTVQKRIVSVPIKDVEGSRLKGETPPPSDLWAWRKYGQKPIKGSPYPRGYYRCSSSKGCPARKQVERSHVDPTMLMITYSCEHNHSPPTNRNNHHHHHHTSAAAGIATAAADPSAATPAAAGPSNSENEISTVFVSELEPNLGEESLIAAEGFRWFSDFEVTSAAMLESPIMAADGDGDMAAMMFSMRGGEDDSLFADLGELPECSVVFRRGVMERDEEESRRCHLAPWCGTTG